MPSQKQLLDVISIQSEIAKLGLDLGDVMALVVDRTLPLIGADGAAIELAEGDEMVYRAASGIAQSHLGLRLKRAQSLSGQCVSEGKLLRCDDSEADPRVDREACRQIGLRSMIVMPLKHRDVTVGVLKALSTSQQKFRKSDEAVLGLLSDVVGSAMFFATKLENDDLFHKATHDGLTGLANRSLFMDRLRNAVARSQREKRPVGVLMIDMDDLKGINDNYGHRVGDLAIRELASRIKAASRQSDTVARLGGDEFAVILSPVDHPAGIDSAVQRLAEQFAPPFSHQNHVYALNASIGAARFPDDSDDLEALLEVADLRMYADKQNRRKRSGSEVH